MAAVSRVMLVLKSNDSGRGEPCCGLKTRAPFFGQHVQGNQGQELREIFLYKISGWRFLRTIRVTSDSSIAIYSLKINFREKFHMDSGCPCGFAKMGHEE
jgi:hypothetical protein